VSEQPRRWRVTERTQVNVDGTVHPAGAEFEATEAQVAQALAAGWVEPAPARPRRK
jgi:hypothetical protein